MSDIINSEANSSSSTALNLAEVLSEITKLKQEIEKIKQEKADLEIILEATTNQADIVAKTLQEKAEEARLESEERFRLIAETTPVSLIISRLIDRQLLYANTSAISLFCLPPERLLNYQELDLYAEPDDWHNLAGICQKNGSIRNYEIRFKKADGTIFWGAISLQPFSLNGKDLLLSAILDITIRKQAEFERIQFTQKLKEKHVELQRLGTLKDEFLIDTSNELCTPLDRIVHLIHSLLQSGASELSLVQQQQLSTVAQEIHKLLNLVNNIRDISHLRNRDIELRLQAVNLRSIVDSILQKNSIIVSSKPLELVNSIPENLPKILADERHLEQIIQNLIDKAIQFTEHGLIEISAVWEEHHPNQIKIIIADTGAGLPTSELEDISALFKQADSLTIHQNQTQDLGLSVAKGLVELHQGKIWVESEVGFVTRFTFTLPLNSSIQSVAPLTHFTTNEPSVIQAINTEYPAVTTAGQSMTMMVTDVATKSPIQKHVHSRIVQVFGKIPLRVILIVPFVVQIVGAVGLVGYLSFKNGQQAVNDLASQLRREVSERVHDQVQNYVEVPQQVNQFNAHAIQLKLLNFRKIRQAEAYFWRQVQTYDSIGNVGFANERGQSTRVGWIDREFNSEPPQIVKQITPGGGDLNYYDIDKEGNRIKLAKTVPNYDPRTRPYYTSAVKKGGSTWSEIYINQGYNLLQIKASRPFYNQDKQLLGVLACELGINQIGKFLQSLKIGRSGQFFIIEPSGELVATSVSNQPLLLGDSQDAKRIRATESDNLLIRSSAAFLSNRFNNLKDIQQPYQLEFMLNNQRQFLQISPFTDQYGLDWLIVVVVPESDFMEQIDANTRTTILLCLATLIVAILVGITTARWVTEPLVQLNFAAKNIAKGEWDKAVEIERSDEVGQLANAFNYMAMQLKESFEILENHKNAFARFFPLEYLKFFQKQYVTHVNLGDHVSKEVAVMFSDIRSFTTLSESMTPQDTFNFVNVYLQQVSPEIRQHKGIIVKYLGDGLMAIFPNCADDAVRAGIAYQKKLQEYNQKRQTKGYLPIYVGIGIHLGHVLVGMIGEEKRMQGDVLSDSVNLTARLEGLTKFYGVSMLISEQVFAQLSDPSQYEIRFIDRVIVKGKTEAISIYEVIDGESEEIKALKWQTRSDFAQGLSHYSRQEFAAAKRYFEQVLAVNLSDKTAKLYLERVDQLISEGVPEKWNGVWRFDQK